MIVDAIIGAMTGGFASIANPIPPIRDYVLSVLVRMSSKTSFLISVS